jgi:hypothetical protein
MGRSFLSFLSKKKRDFTITFLTSLLSISPPINFQNFIPIELFALEFEVFPHEVLHEYSCGVQFFNLQISKFRKNTSIKIKLN